MANDGLYRTNNGLLIKSISASSFFLTVVGQHTRGRRQSASGTKQLADGRRLSGDRGR
jgi:hypothetical protein